MECKKCIQVPLNDVLTIPDHIPETDFILRVTSTPIIDNAIVIDRQINFSGRVLLCVETVSAKSDCPQTVHFFSSEAPFVGLIDHCCARVNMDAQLSASIKHQEFKMLSPRCISKLIVVKVCIVRLTKSCKPLNTHCSEPHLTLLCGNFHPPVCPSATLRVEPSDELIDLPIEPNDFYLPQTITDCSTEHTENAPCAICGCKIDPI
ncbi:MAG: DUF3794 domain-containing protein [Sporomusaceae bacterium]|nr:DUF3794 domain-containing protein [Sporomusaceae bacterium]